MKKIITQASLITFVFTTLTACSGGVPRKPVNELPSNIEIVTVNFQTGAWKLRLTHRQKEKRVNNQIACGLYTDHKHSLAFDRINVPDLSYLFTETIDIPAMPVDLEMPKGLTDKMNYQLECDLTSENYYTESIRKSGTLHRVPGEQALYR